MDPIATTCNHEYVITNAYTGGTDYECKLCGHKKTESTLPKAYDTGSGSNSANDGYLPTKRTPSERSTRSSPPDWKLSLCVA